MASTATRTGVVSARDARRVAGLERGDQRGVGGTAIRWQSRHRDRSLDDLGDGKLEDVARSGRLQLRQQGVDPSLGTTVSTAAWSL